MSAGILQELQFFCRAVLMGIVMALAYELLGLLRRLIPHRTGVVAAEDLLYWLLCGAGIFRMMYRENSGAIRGFAIAAVIIGMLLFLQAIKICRKIRKKLHTFLKRRIM